MEEKGNQDELEYSDSDSGEEYLNSSLSEDESEKKSEEELWNFNRQAFCSSFATTVDCTAFYVICSMFMLRVNLVLFQPLLNC